MVNLYANIKLIQQVGGDVFGSGISSKLEQIIIKNLCYVILILTTHVCFLSHVIDRRYISSNLRGHQ